MDLIRVRVDSVPGGLSLWGRGDGYESNVSYVTYVSYRFGTRWREKRRFLANLRIFE